MVQVMRIRQCKVGWNQGFGYAAVHVHHVEAKTARQVADKVEAIADNLGLHKLAGGEERLDAKLLHIQIPIDDQELPGALPARFRLYART